MTPAAAAGSGGAGVVIPLRSFRNAMRRLAGVLDPDERESLARDLASRVRAAAGELPVAVITDDPAVIDWATANGCAVRSDPGSLDAAAAAGQAWAAERGLARVVIAHADLPRATSFAAATADGAAPVAVVVPDHRDDGTPVLSIPTAVRFPFAYGPGSAARHIAAAEALGLAVRVLHDPDLAFDIDLETDLAALTRAPGEP
ncbi:MAG: 2-phospho-L-lactate guanylyltransferase [Actinomycetota bacterium]